MADIHWKATASTSRTETFEGVTWVDDSVSDDIAAEIIEGVASMEMEKRELTELDNVEFDR